MTVTLYGNKLNTSFGKILVMMSKPDKVTASGIIIPSTMNKETDYLGEVASVSRTENKIKVGDQVIIKKHSGTIIETDDTLNVYKMFLKTEILYVC